MSHSDHFHVRGQAMDWPAVGGTWSTPAVDVPRAAELEPDPPLFTEPVIGYRAWRIADGTLVSPYRRGTWPPGEVRASCGRAMIERWANPRGGPAEPAHHIADCTCGLYAYHSLDTLPCGGVGYNEIVGAVVGWGEMHVHPTGWRAERACVVALLNDEALLPYNPAGVAHHYGVPLVVSRGHLQFEAAVHGSPLPSSAIPEGRDITDYFTITISGQAKTAAAAMSEVQQAFQKLRDAVAGQVTADIKKLAAVARGDRRGGPRGPRARGVRPRGVRR